MAVLKRLKQAGITLNETKSEIRKTKLNILFCGSIIDSEGIRPDLAKTEALARPCTTTCQNVADVRRFLGMANQLGQFTPTLTTLSQPLRELLKKDN